MAIEMTHWERVKAAIKGRDVDRVPVSMWRHFFTMETNGEKLAEVMLGFQEQFDWDFMKVNPRASYHVEDWGVKVEYSGDAEPAITGTPVKEPADWLKIKVLDINKGVLGEHLKSLEIIARKLKGEVPFIMTVFTPFSIAERLIDSEDIFLQHLHEHTSKVNYTLDVITETFTRFSKACLERGASGIFFATTSWATTDRLTEKEYNTFARPYDLALLSALPPSRFNVLHVCRQNNFLPAFADYPVQAFSWDPRGLGNPSLLEGKMMVNGKLVIGGIPRDKSLVESGPAELAAEIHGMHLAIGRMGWMLGSGCTFPHETSEANIRAIREAAAWKPHDEHK
jgi:uroporphyrinogen decarboxylase